MARLILVCAFLLSLAGVQAMERDTTTSVASDDPEMVATINRARGTIGQFFDAFMKPEKGQTSFLLKVPFTHGEQVEHIWLADLEFSGGKAFGVIANEPKIDSLHFKQRVEFDPRKATDWMYVENGVLVGGYTTRLLRQRMTVEQRKAFDEATPYKF